MCQQLSHKSKGPTITKTYKLDRRYMVSYQIVGMNSCRYLYWLCIQFHLCMTHRQKSAITHTFALMANRKNETAAIDVKIFLNLLWRISKRKAFCANAFLRRKSFIHSCREKITTPHELTVVFYLLLLFWHYHHTQCTVIAIIIDIQSNKCCY